MRHKIYTFEDFLKAVGSFPAFCGESKEGSKMSKENICKKELATLFAHMTQETGGKKDEFRGIKEKWR